MIRVGPAGWSYPDWQGIVYPAPAPRGFDPLAHLARLFPCIELNSSFYAPPGAEMAERWSARVAPCAEFRFLAKVHRDFTHTSAPAEGPDDPWPAAAASFLAGLAPLERDGRLAALLLQFPAGFARNPANARRLERLNELFAAPGRRALAVELRHRSWFVPAALERFSALGLAVAHIDLPAAPEHPPVWHEPTASLGYLRLHGRNARTWFQPGVGRDARYDYLYGPAELDELAARARRLAGATDETFVVTNNHFEGQAVANALELRSLLEGTPPAAPIELQARFPRLRVGTRPQGQGRLF